MSVQGLIYVLGQVVQAKVPRGLKIFRVWDDNLVNKQVFKKSPRILANPQCVFRTHKIIFEAIWFYIGETKW
jgi:hypothetical protein